MDLMAVVFWGFLGLVVALMIGVFVYVRWTQPAFRSSRARSRNPTLAEVRAMHATEVPRSLAAIFKAAAVVCALLGLVILGWLATLE